ncbi:MAG: decarboxylating 6-phosphogluconate dehydrogenase [Rhodococcus sp.]|nr:decarboxylating 6-phosphogluconate dehydrogenase [Rhodococcus sp. (in: high G+C Gram-positive bacteria)]
MRIGLVGLGKMGFNMRERLRSRGVDVVGYDPRPEVSDVETLAGLVDSLPAPRTVWVMVPAGEATRVTIRELSELLEPGDLLIDGGNTRFSEDAPHAEILERGGIGFLDCGVSGGIWGREGGYGLMVGGSAHNVERALPIFDALRPDGDRADGFVHAGPVGAGHYAKMVHNGIEYGLMQAYAEGYELLSSKDLIENVPAVLRAWTQGTVVRSWLLDLLVKALDEDPRLADITGYAEDSGEGRWTVQDAIDEAVPVPVIAAALFARFASRQEDSPTMKAVSALRAQFGGHASQQTTSTPQGEPDSGSPSAT